MDGVSMKTRSTYKAALYMRLSKDDGAGESASITTQRKMLRCYAAEKGYAVYDEYVDDGWSGTNFDRPGFLRMIADIEAKRVNLVITKDLSRLGRDYITAGQYTEIYFPSKGVRYIAINDGYDSDSPYTDIAPFKNVINEMYARDTSKKIRSAFHTRMREGAFIGAFAPYGYRKDPEDKHRLLIDERAGEVVREMFRLARDGKLPIEIARQFNGRNIPSPAVYRSMNRPELQERTERREWTSATVTKMLRNVVYLGHTAQGKTTKVSFKSHLTVNNPREDWILVKNTHEPLVDEETFDIVRRRSASRTCEKTGGFSNIFSGLAKCADCGHNMSTTGTRKKGAKANLTCGGYKLHGSDACSNHFIDYDVLSGIVRESLREQLDLSREQRGSILQSAEKRQRKEKPGTEETLSRMKKRLKELDGIIGKLYEDHAGGRLSEARMNKMLKKYESESAELESGIAKLQEPPPETAKPPREKLNALLSRITDAEELSPELLFPLIDRIEIGQGHYERTGEGKVKRQAVKIYYRFETLPEVREITM